MHKGVILLIKASQRDEAKDKVQEFMVHYGDGDIWDWYVIGGRWSGTLNSKSKEFFTEGPPGLLTVTEAPSGINTVTPSIEKTSRLEDLGEIIRGSPFSMIKALSLNTCFLPGILVGTPTLDGKNS